MLCPIILGSDKTTVSVATGNVEYHPLYLSIGNVHNSVRRAHHNAVVPIGFLAIPKGLFDDTFGLTCLTTYLQVTERTRVLPRSAPSSVR